MNSTRKRRKKTAAFLTAMIIAALATVPESMSLHSYVSADESMEEEFLDEDDFTEDDEYPRDDEYPEDDELPEEEPTEATDKPEISDGEVPKGFTPIYTIEDLYAIRNNLYGNYILMNDIDMTEDTAPGGDWDVNGKGWEPIGTEEEDFRGRFSGNGHAIIGMNIHGNVEGDIGLFGCVSSDYANKGYGIIEGLKMVDVNINISTSNAYYLSVGSIAGRFTNLGEIRKCFTSGEIVATDIDDYTVGYAGGIVGSAECNITDCYNAINIKTSGLFTGGIAGENDQVSETKYCYNTGNIDAEQDLKSAIGSGSGKFISCYSLKGTCEGIKTNMYKELSVAQMKSAGVFTDWDFDNVWVIDSTSSYNYPQLRACMQIPVTSITMISAPTKDTYVKGNKIDITGAEISVYHEDDNTTGETSVTEDMLGEYNMDKIGMQKIDVTYINKSASFEITVNPESVTNLSVSELTEDSATITWDKLDYVSGYYIYKRSNENEEWKECEKTDKVKFTDTEENLSTEFMYAVSAYVAIDDIDYVSEKEIALKPIDFTKVKVTVDELTYKGETLKIEPNVIYNGEKLTEGKDYNITDGDFEVNKPGDYSITLTGKGNYAGIVTVEFTVKSDRILGDISGNDKIDLYDAIEIAKSLIGVRKFTDEEKAIADFNQDGKVDLYDAIAIAKYLLKK